MTWIVGAIKGALGGVWAWAAAALATLVAILAALSKAKKAGRDEVIAKAKEKEVENVKKAAKVEREIAVTPADERRARMRQRWTRKQ